MRNKSRFISSCIYVSLTGSAPLMSSGNDATSAPEIAACVSGCGVVNGADFTINSQDALVSRIPCGEPVCYMSGLYLLLLWCQNTIKHCTTHMHANLTVLKQSVLIPYKSYEVYCSVHPECDYTSDTWMSVESDKRST